MELLFSVKSIPFIHKYIMECMLLITFETGHFLLTVNEIDRSILI